jgi:hypothetical protein
MSKLSNEQKLMIYDAFIETFIESGAENYLSLTFECDDKTEYEILISKISGVTPAQKNLILEKRIAELEAEVSQSDEILAEHDLINYNLMEEQDKRIAELEKERDELNEKFEEYFDAFMNCKCIPRDMEAHNLEQQAKGAVNGYLSACKWALGNQYDEVVSKNRALEYAKQLRQQAKGES